MVDWMCLAHVHGCRWRNFLSPDIEHPRKSPFTEWEIAVVVLVRDTAPVLITKVAHSK